MELLLQITRFLNLIVLFLSILIVIKECFRVYKSVRRREEYLLTKNESLFLLISLSYILTNIFY